MKMYASIGRRGSIERVADKWVTFMRHTRANLVPSSWAEQFNFDKRVRSRLGRRFPYP